jgi:hypothetical protein
MKHLAILLIGFFITSSALAAKIISVKQNKVLIDLEGQDLPVGQKLFSIDSTGKKRAVLQIRQVKGGKAVADITKGQSVPAHRLQVIAGGPPMNTAKTDAQSSTPRSHKGAGRGNSSWGLQGGYAMNTMKVKLSSTPVDLSGSSMSLKGFYATKLDGAISVKGSVGYETFAAKGTISSGVCGSSNTADCSVEISYLGMDALIRYSFIDSSSIHFWAGGGLAFLFAIGKESNVLDTGKITSNQAIVGAVGFDYNLSGGSFIPVELNYNLFPDNNSTSASQMVLRVGYGWDF